MSAPARILVTGAGGLVGSHLCRALPPDVDVVGVTRTTPAPAGVPSISVLLDRPAETRAAFETLRPDVVVHAAYSSSDLDRDVVAATRSVADSAAAVGASLVVLSTDAVFFGDAPPYGEDARPEPVHPYGRAKRAAEEHAVASVPDAAVVRLALVAHLDRARPDRATRWLIEADAERRPVTVFTDEIRSVVRLEDVIDGLVALLHRPPAGRPGVWHLGGPTAMSRAELAAVAVARLGLDPRWYRPGLAAEHPESRPRDVSLSCGRAMAQLGWAPRAVGTVARHGPTH